MADVSGYSGESLTGLGFRKSSVNGFEAQNMFGQRGDIDCIADTIRDRIKQYAIRQTISYQVGQF